MAYEVVIGLEVHVQLNTDTKIFCGCSTEFGAAPNTHVCPVCMGQPGVLPVLNTNALEKAIRAGLALDCEIPEYSKFDRKNYFYPDLPKGYQISQFDFPVAVRGHLDIDMADGSVKRIGVTRAHMEEDAGKLVHAEGASVSWVDLNRAGVPLLEIVSEPDMRGSDEAVAYLKSLKSIMKYCGVSDVNMEEGSLRCDANISIRPFGQKEFGTKVEIKNMNSFTNVKKAVEYEIVRQTEAAESGTKIVQETRLWDAQKGKTFSMRSKEEANDYRYFPEPDLPPVVTSREKVETARKALPELPRAKKQRFVSEYGVTPYDAETLADEKEVADYFEAVSKATRAGGKKAANWIQAEVLAVLNETGRSIVDFAENSVSAINLAELLDAVEDGTISGRAGKEVFVEMIAAGKGAKAVIAARGLQQVSDTSVLEKAVDEVLAANPDAVEKYRGGKTNLMGFFVGEIMKKTKGQANPKMVNELLKGKLG
jgi:aspartyl-tRNA(Asn)/glutamyl-tRNA(Gln) amidotransferase subunit B